MSNPEILVKIGADAAGINTGVNQSNAALERLVQEVQRSNSQMQQGFMQSSLALREIARASGETAGAIGNLSSQAKPASTGMVSGFGAIGLAISGIKQSVELAGQAIKTALGPSAQMQSLQVQFGVLLGSTSAAKDRMQDLVKFADTTPFELPEVAKASKVLETLTKGALSTGEGLRLVGDVAAATGQPFDELSTWVGRLYDGLQSGRPVGEAMQRLQELGAVSGDTRAEIEKLQKEGKKGPEVWDVAKKSFEQYSGMMDAQSKTFEGLASTMQDSLGGVLREFGDQILPTASGATQDLTGMFNDLKPAAAALGWVVSSTVKVFREAFIMFKALGQQVLPMLAADFAMNIADMLTVLIGFAEKVNGLFGELLPESWTKGIGEGLASAKAWSNGLSSSMREVGDTARKELGDVGTAMLNVYAGPEEIDVPGKTKGKKKTADGPSDKEKKAAEKAAKEAAKAQEEQEKATAKASEERFSTLQKNKQELQIASAKEGRDRELTALNLKLKDETACYEDGSKMKLAIEAKYQKERDNINAKWDEKELEQEKKQQQLLISTLTDEVKKARLVRMMQHQEEVKAAQGNARLLLAVERKYVADLKKIDDDAVREKQQAYLAITNSQAQMWNTMADVMKKGISEQSAAYKAMFAISKGFAIANAIISMQMNIAEGMKKGWPQNLVFMAAAAAQGATVIADIQSVSASFAVGTPTVPQDMVAQIHKGETIVPATFAEGIRRGEMTLGGPGGGKGSNHSASLVLPDDIMAAIASKGSALVKIMNNQGRVSFA